MRCGMGSPEAAASSDTDGAELLPLVRCGLASSNGKAAMGMMSYGA
jgi:hypothetical protein